jgi:acyl dehydratase
MPKHLPDHEVVAFNTATSSENKIHDDAVAARLGFGAGLVPGVDVYAYLCRPAVELWGAAFCAPSRVAVRFDRPVHDGEAVRIRSEIDDDGLLRAGADTVNGRCATLEAAINCGLAPPPATLTAPLPAERPAASPVSLAAGTALGSLSACCEAEDLAAYLADVRDEASPLAGQGLVHPGWLLRPANYLLSQNVVLGPWMHVGSVIHHHRPVELGEELSVRGFVRDHYEHKGHRFVVADAVMYGADGVARCAVEHTAIYEPRQVRKAAFS